MAESPLPSQPQASDAHEDDPVPTRAELARAPQAAVAESASLSAVETSAPATPPTLETSDEPLVAVSTPDEGRGSEVTALEIEAAPAGIEVAEPVQAAPIAPEPPALETAEPAVSTGSEPFATPPVASSPLEQPTAGAVPGAEHGAASPAAEPIESQPDPGVTAPATYVTEATAAPTMPVTAPEGTVVLPEEGSLRPDEAGPYGGPVTASSSLAAPIPIPPPAPTRASGPNWMLAFVSAWAGAQSLFEAWNVVSVAGGHLTQAVLTSSAFLGYGLLGLGLVAFGLESLQSGKRQSGAVPLLSVLIPTALTLAGVIYLILSKDPGRRI